MLSLDETILSGGVFSKCAFEDLDAKLSGWIAGLPSVTSWGTFLRLREGVEKAGAAPLLVLIDRDEIDPDDVVPTFQGLSSQARFPLIYFCLPSVVVGQRHTAGTTHGAETSFSAAIVVFDVTGESAVGRHGELLRSVVSAVLGAGCYAAALPSFGIAIVFPKRCPSSPW